MGGHVSHYSMNSVYSKISVLGGKSVTFWEHKFKSINTEVLE